MTELTRNAEARALAARNARSEALHETLPNQAERAAALLTPAERDLFAVARPGVSMPEPDVSWYDPETSVALWRRAEPVAPHRDRWHVLVLDEHAGEAPTLADAIKLAARACHENTGGDRHAPGVLTWWASAEHDGGIDDPLPVALDLRAPGTAAVLDAAWREFQSRELTVTVTFSAPREWLEATVQMFGAEIQERHARGEDGGPDETFAHALSEAVDQAAHAGGVV